MLKLRLDRAQSLLGQGRADQALAVTEPLARAFASAGALGLHASALKALGRHDEALGWDREAVARFPESRIAWHNLAATLGDLGRGEEAAAAAREAFGRGLDAPETWLVYGRALAAAGDLSGGEMALGEARRRSPANALLASELAELIWTARGSLPDAIAVLRAAEAGGAPATPLVLREAGLLRAAGDPEAALARLAEAVRRDPQDLPLTLALSDALLKSGRPGDALAAAQAVLARQPRSAPALSHLSAAELAIGRPGAALAAARAGLALEPLAQALLNAEATAARAAGDPAYARLCDHEAMVGEYELERPDGWPTLAAYMDDLARALAGLHAAARHPTDQSLQGGSQTTFRLSGAADPAIRAFFTAIDYPITRHIEALGPGDDPLRRRRTAGWRMSGVWSVLLRSNDFHRDHIHSEGWLSSAFYVETPQAALAQPGREGWLRFGQPAFETAPPLPAEHHVKPAVGKLALFPSYMWHGTEPFMTDERRMTIAFDVVPV